MSKAPFARSLAFLEEWMTEIAAKTPKLYRHTHPVVPGGTTTTTTTGSSSAPASSKPAEQKEQPKKDDREAQRAKKAADKEAQKQKQKDKQPAAAASDEPSRTAMSRVNLLCGRVVDCQAHAESENLWIEQIDVGGEAPVQILSGMRKHLTAEEFMNQMVVVVANLEPRKMGGVPSNGMVLCASNADKSVVKLLNVPEGVKPGERITFAGHDGAAEPVLKKKLAKCWDEVAPQLKTDANGVALFGDLPFKTSLGEVVCKAIPDGIVS